MSFDYTLLVLLDYWLLIIHNSWFPKPKYSFFYLIPWFITQLPPPILHQENETETSRFLILGPLKCDFKRFQGNLKWFNCSKIYLLAELVHFFFLTTRLFYVQFRGFDRTTRTTTRSTPELLLITSKPRGMYFKYKIRSLWNSRVRKNWWLLEDRRNLAYTGT